MPPLMPIALAYADGEHPLCEASAPPDLGADPARTGTERLPLTAGSRSRAHRPYRDTSPRARNRRRHHMNTSPHLCACPCLRMRERKAKSPVLHKPTDNPRITP
jgi:hypothetical protein